MRASSLIIAIAIILALPAAGQFPINESFMTGSAPGWIFGANTGSTFTPCLTSGNAACGNDPAGQGWLRLTDTGGNEAGFAYFDTSFPSSQGFSIDFEYVAWGGNGADGIGIILFDGATSTFRIGAPGGSFGYAADCPATGLLGLSNGYLGFAIDEWGNFKNAGDRCKNGGPGPTPDSISVRGPGNGDNSGTNYAYIAGTGALTPGIDSPGGATRPLPTSYYRHVLIYVTPNGDGTVTYTVKWLTSLFGSFTTVLTGTTGALTTPATLKLGFTASTGGSNNYHEVRNVKVSYPADLAVTKTHSPPSPVPGGSVTYTMVVTNNGPVNVTGASFFDTVPANLSGVTWTCTVTGTGSCSAASGSGNQITVSLNLNNGASATITATGTLPNTTPQQLINTATITPPSNITDTNPNNNSATDIIDIGTGQAPISIVKTASSLMLQSNGSEYFILVVTNAGPGTATNVTVTDTLTNPPFASVGTVTTTQGTCSVVGLAVTCPLGSIPPTGTATIVIPATVINNPGNHANAYTNSASASWAESGTPATSNTVTLSTRNAAQNSTDLAVTKTHSPASPSAGGTVTYTMVVTNTGSNVTGATFSDTVPPSITGVTWTCAVTGTGSCPASGSGNSISFSTLNLNSGSSATITATGTIASTAPTSIFNTATVTLPTGWYDTNGANNTVTDWVSISVPVTVARFRAVSERDGVRFHWTSAIEASNAGYHLYAETAQGRVRLNERLIPSRAPDSTVPVGYETFIPGAPPGPYLLEDVDIRTGVRRHGPFLADRDYGAEPVAERIHWASVRAPSLVSRVVPRPTPAQSVNFLVDHDGIYRVTYESLKAAGFDLGGIPVQQLALTSRGVSVPLLVVGPGTAMGDSPGRAFGPGVAVEFFGTAVDSLYTHTNVYTLGRNSPAVSRVTLDATPAPGGAAAPYYLETVTVTKPLQYSFASPTGNPWYESGILAYTSPVSQTFTVPVDNLVTSAGGGEFSFHMWGGTDWPNASPDHHAVVALNGQTVADDLFNGMTDYPVSGSLPGGVLTEGANTLTLTLPGDSGVDYEIVNVTNYGLTYPRRFVARSGALSFTSDGSVLAVDGLPSSNVVVYRLGGAVPQRLTQVQIQPGAVALAARFAGTGKSDSYSVYDASALSTPVYAAFPPPSQIRGGFADYLIIAHPSFISGVDPLVRARSGQGHRVKVVNVNDVYATFSYGIVDPQAIHDYIAYASSRMRTRYVLLVGGDTYDYFDCLKTGSVSFIPTPYAPTGDLITYAPADPLLADVDGDGVPDVALGRLPVRTPAELDTVVAKILAYGGRSVGAVFAADAADSGFSFGKVSDQLAALLPAAWPVTRAHIDDLGAPAARTALIGAMNSGVPFASYVGHSGFTEWSFSSLFTAADAVALFNVGSPFVVTQWGCWNTYYVEPHSDTLAHKLLLAGPQGAAAVLGPATLSDVGSEAAFARLLLPLVFQQGLPLGTALTQAKKQLAASQPQALDVLRGWTLLGDPALVVAPATSSRGRAVVTEPVDE